MMTTFVRIISLFIIGTIPILFAAVEPWVWSLYGLLMLAAFILVLWTVRGQSVFPRVRRSYTPAAVFFIWTLFLCVPFPFPVLSFLSPTRADILSHAWALNGSAPAWEAVSYLPEDALSRWVFLLGLGLFFLVVRNLCTERNTLRGVVFVMIGIGLIEAVYGLIQALVPSMGVLWVDYIPDYLGTARGTFINRNSFAAFIGTIWPLALGITLAMTGRVRSLRAALGSDRLNRQALMALGIIVFLLALIFTRSRAGIASGLVGFLVFILMARTGMNAVARQSRVLLGGILVMLIIYTMTIGVGPIMQRFLTLGGDGGSRMDIWRDSLPIVKNHPLGIGLGNYEKVFQVYNRSLVSEKTVIHAHNDYLQLLIEAGWIGFMAIMSGFWIFLGKRARRIRQLDFSNDPLRFFLAVGAFSGLISMAVHCLFDFNLQIPANCVYVVVLMAILSACTRSGRPLPQRTGALQGRPSPDHRQPASARIHRASR
ncbi:MAG: O-antigen ligase family protein [Deltaproteobacteria bacterium]|nr:O-antigen ligase family protein [Deltaproteobacteria bacterium]